MLIGRDGQMSALDALLADARAGREGALVLRGDAGVGKSTLLEYARATGIDMHVLAGAGVERHWVDRASTEALAFAARRLEVEPIAVPFAARDEPGRVFEAPGVPDLVLSPLGPSESRAVVAAHFGDRVAPAVVDWLVASANGNPLALIELPRGLTPEQVNGQESLSATVPPATTVESGLNGMNDATRAHIAGWQPGPHAGDPQRRRGSSVTASRFGSANSDRLIIISVFWDGARQAKALGLAST